MAGVEVGMNVGLGTGVVEGKGVGVLPRSDLFKDPRSDLGLGEGEMTASTRLAVCNLSDPSFDGASDEENKNKPPMAASPEIIIIKSFELKENLSL